jgi:hypothetical protein
MRGRGEAYASPCVREKGALFGKRAIPKLTCNSCMNRSRASGPYSWCPRKAPRPLDDSFVSALDDCERLSQPPEVGCREPLRFAIGYARRRRVRRFAGGDPAMPNGAATRSARKFSVLHQILLAEGMIIEYLSGCRTFITRVKGTRHAFRSSSACWAGQAGTAT